MHYAIQGNTLTAIADAIREQAGTDTAYLPGEMPEAIRGMTQGGGATFNLAYGDTAPEDTGKLWIKCPPPDHVRVTAAPVVGNEDLQEYLSALPKTAKYMAAAAVGTTVYLFGGADSTTKYSPSIYAFDTESNTLTTLSTTLLQPAQGIAAAAVGTKIYLFGGNYSTSGQASVIQVFDTQTHGITMLNTFLPTGAREMAAVAVGKNIYLFGGHGTDVELSGIHVFDTETDTIATLSTVLPEAAYAMAAAAAGTKIYLFGGRGRESGCLSAIRIFDTETGTIDTLSTSLPMRAYQIAAGAVGRKIYLLGGYGDTELSSIHAFDTATNTVTTLGAALPTKACGIAAATVGTRVYLFGGCCDAAGNSLATIHAFTASLPLAENELLIEASSTKNLFALLPNVELGVANVYLGNADGYAQRVPKYTHHTEHETVYESYYTSSAAELASGTAFSASIHCGVGDLVVAAILTRDTMTVSNGWTLISTSGFNSADTTGNGQRLSWAYKFAESTEESITVSQASAQRMYINMIALPGATGVIDNGYSYRNDTTSGSMTLSKPEGLVLWGMTSPLWTTIAPYRLWEISNNSPVIQLGSETQPRLGVALDQSDDAIVTMEAGSTATTMIVGSLTVEGIPKFYASFNTVRDVWREI